MLQPCFWLCFLRGCCSGFAVHVPVHEPVISTLLSQARHCRTTLCSLWVATITLGFCLFLPCGAALLWLPFAFLFEGRKAFPARPNSGELPCVCLLPSGLLSNLGASSSSRPALLTLGPGSGQDRAHFCRKGHSWDQEVVLCHLITRGGKEGVSSGWASVADRALGCCRFRVGGSSWLGPALSQKESLGGTSGQVRLCRERLACESLSSVHFSY